MRIDFHIHSKYSFDCFLEPAMIIKMARLRGLDGIAIADHDTMAGIDEFRRLAPDLYVIAAEEISTPQGDILGLFLKEKVQAENNAGSVVKAIRAQGALAVAAHPFKWPHLFRREGYLEQFDVVETFNARNNIPFPYLENFLCSRRVAKLGMPCVAGSDSHQAAEVGLAATIFDFSANEASDEKIKEAILSKKIRIEGREVPLHYEIVSHFSRLAKSLKKS